MSITADQNLQLFTDNVTSHFRGDDPPHPQITKKTNKTLTMQSRQDVFPYIFQKQRGIIVNFMEGFKYMSK